MDNQVIEKDEIKPLWRYVSKLKKKKKKKFLLVKKIQKIKIILIFFIKILK